MAARVLLAFAILAGSLWALVPSPARACICAPQEAQDFVGKADVIVIGKVVEIRTGHQTYLLDLVDAPDVTRVREIPVYQVATQEYISGGGSSFLEVQDVNGPCGWPIEETGGEYLLFLQLGEGGSLLRLDCSGSFEIKRYTPQSSIDLIRKEAALQGKHAISSVTDDPIPPWATAVSFGAAIALGVGLLFGVRRLAGG